MLGGILIVVSRWSVNSIPNSTSKFFAAELFVEHEDELPIPENQTVSNSCPFMVNTATHSEWAYKAPVILILACNMLFLIYIMTVSQTRFWLNFSIRESWTFNESQAFTILNILMYSCPSMVNTATHSKWA